MPLRRLQGDRGFTLIEVLVAMVVLLVGLMGTVTLVNTANARSGATKAREGATNLAREISEQVRILPYSSVTTPLLDGRLQIQPGLADASASDPGWQIVRRNFTYTVSTALCTVDDRGDGYGSHAAGGFCSDSATVGILDPQDDDLRRVTVSVTYTDKGLTRTARSTTTLNSALQVTGMPVTALSLNRTSPTSTISPSTTEPVIGTAVNTLTFRATTPSDATGIVYSIQGQTGSPAATRLNTTDWEFTWTITGLSDGLYFVSAQAVDAQGQLGPAREIPVRLARGVPPALTDLQGGFNTVRDAGVSKSVAELQWSASTSLNVEGYKVLRPDGSTACTTASVKDTTCIDFSPAAQTGTTAARTYSVVSLYHDAAGVAKQSSAATVVLPPISTTTSSPLVTPVSRDYRLGAGTANTGTNCTASTLVGDMLDGVDGTFGSTAGAAGKTLNFCSPAVGAGEAVAAGPVTFSIAFDETLNPAKTCLITATLSRQGSASTTISSGTYTATNTTNQSTVNFTMSNASALPLTAGDRLNLRLSFQNTNNCASVTVYYGIYNGSNLGLVGLGTTTTSTVTNTTTTLPDPPTGFTATPQADGTVLLQWNKPTTGPAVDFYRIYMDGKNYTDRLNTTGDGVATTETYTVPGGAHTYYVTSVAPTMTESAFTAGVTTP